MLLHRPPALRPAAPGVGLRTRPSHPRTANRGGPAAASTSSPHASPAVAPPPPPLAPPPLDGEEDKDADFCGVEGATRGGDMEMRRQAG